jgi:predicted nucleotidyltransferase component of viral defense system
MQNQLDIVRDISARLDTADIGYMLTGSMAMNCYIPPRVPRNIDFVIALRAEDAEVMVRLFSPDYDISREAVDSAIAQQSFFNFNHRKSRIKVNCIICQQIKYHLTEYNRRQRVKFENFKTWIVSKEDLIISKLHWARKSLSQRHLRDVTNLAATGCDTVYIERWTRALGIFKLWEECSQG